MAENNSEMPNGIIDPNESKNEMYEQILAKLVAKGLSGNVLKEAFKKEKEKRSGEKNKIE